MVNELEVEAKEFNVIDEGLHPGTVKKVEAGPPGKFGPTFRWTYEITGPDDSDFLGTEVDELTGRDMTPNAKVSDRYRAATGQTVEPGQRYNLATAIGKPVQLMIKHKVSEKGSVWPQVSDVLAAPKKKQRVVVVDDDEDDDLADA